MADETNGLVEFAHAADQIDRAQLVQALAFGITDAVRGDLLQLHARLLGLVFGLSADSIEEAQQAGFDPMFGITVLKRALERIIASQAPSDAERERGN